MDIKKIINKLVSSSKNETIEVEDLLKLVHINNKNLIQPLLELKNNYNWQETNTELTLPLGTWVNIICEYLNNGYSGLVKISKSNKEMLPFALGVFEELRTKDSIYSLYDLLTSFNLNNEDDHLSILEIVSTINLVMSFKTRPNIEETKVALIAAHIKTIILKLLESKNYNENNVSLCVLSLRGLGNSETIDFIKKIPPFKKQENLDVIKMTLNSIKKRINNIT